MKVYTTIIHIFTTKAQLIIKDRSKTGFICSIKKTNSTENKLSFLAQNPFNKNKKWMSLLPENENENK